MLAITSKMEEISKNKSVCPLCNGEYRHVKRHIRDYHANSSHLLVPLITNLAELQIHCPLCIHQTKFPFYNDLNNHLTQDHGIIMTEFILNLNNINEFIIWKALENKEVDYCCSMRIKRPYGEDVIYECKKRVLAGRRCSNNRKIKGDNNIHISEGCPSRIIATILNNGKITVYYTETHVGHEDILEGMRMTKEEQELMVKKICVCSAWNKTREVAKSMRSEKFKRLKLALARGDAANLNSVHNIDINKDLNSLNAEKTVLYVDKPSGSENNNTNNMNLLIEHVDSTSQQNNSSFKRETIWMSITNFSMTLDDESFNAFIAAILKAKNIITDQKNVKLHNIQCKKQKVEH
ncbi:hypothetical protein ABEB36_007024 [Hypothenemus hampei]|uniref:Uncharacterized protein n=1 Tax=Hypothenemus hampei TaxID=57062 RepID=A0ABD1ET25_HYPHA